MTMPADLKMLAPNCRTESNTISIDASVKMLMASALRSSDEIQSVSETEAWAASARVVADTWRNQSISEIGAILPI